MYAVTGASGRLGRMVLDALLRKAPANQIVALTRDPSKLSELAKMGVIIRPFDFNNTATLRPALTGVERLLLISGSDVGKRERQHSTVIQAAKDAGVAFIAYTSVLHADTCTINLASEHRGTELAIKESGLNYALLRHGWYTENTTMSAARDIARGMVIGCAGSGRQSTATRADFAAADAAVLLDGSVVKQIYELAGDSGYSLSDYAAALSEVSKTTIRYIDLPQAEYQEVLERDGLPKHVATLLAEASARCAENVMFDEDGALGKLLGHPTTPLHTSIEEALVGTQPKDEHIFNHAEI